MGVLFEAYDEGVDYYEGESEYSIEASITYYYYYYY